ncbi:hypothetical protein HY637_01315 [Candidatus Woesearchaeota archaeon]|nr:hypothetical protein [Candidatus Woesearchaeota archaeon]
MSKKLEVKRKIIIDLDVVTVAKWDKGRNGEISRKFIISVAKKAFHLITPTLLLELVRKWKHEKLRIRIEEFYSKNSDELIDRLQIIEEIVSKKIDFEELFGSFIEIGIKEEDVTLILVSSLRDALLITFNKVHLKNKEEEINEILSKYGLRAIKITSPEQI